MAMELMIDGLLAILLLVTIGYAVVLNRKLNQFRNLREEMQGMVGEFAQATQDAEKGIASLQSRSQTLGSDLEKQVSAVEGRVSEARSLADDLVFLVEKGTSVADRLENSVSKGLAASPKTSDETPPSGRKAAPKDRKESGGISQRQGQGQEQTRKASDSVSPEARDLLKTLDGIR
ncbi:DUF6468 domain-containing protein [Fodinicurvata sediminis]|uniref:DUF6468 domain-containing protein n=1 Tax=Fodinicurvata sediminis TaxID=1121832 RepID=UPI0003B55E8A|nr:DUF6468 domain-containing protein [Fodinicurvata sediminis]